MNVTKTLTSTATSTTIVLSDLDEGQMRRFERIMRAQANNMQYNGELTTAFAQQVVDALN